MTKNNGTLLILIATGALCLAISYWLLKSPTTPTSKNYLATVEPSYGTVSVLRKSYSSKEDIKGTTSLYPLDTIEVGSDAEANLDFPSGQQLILTANSAVTINQESNAIILVLRRGLIQQTKTGEKNRIFISKNGVRWELNDYLSMNSHEAPLLSTSDAPAVRPLTSDSPTPEYIASILTGYRDSFQRCYSQLILKDPQAKGECSLSFTVQKNGKTSDVKTVSCTMTGPDSDKSFLKIFDKCLHEVVRRAQFKSFSGEPVTTVFPLKFE